MKFSHFAPLVIFLAAAGTPLFGQAFYFGSDLSYVNEMEDCGVVFRENATPKDPYQIFADHGTNLVRLRLWHTPAWLDTLNAGKRYADFQDVQKSIMRAKAAGMQVLLDFHLSDSWADPSKQRVPKAWEGVVDNLPLLKDSLYKYVSKALLLLDAEGLLPEMVQIGNETNKGILLSPQQDAGGWVLDWNRNSQLFKTAIQAVRDVENSTGKTVKVALHLAGPADTGWLMQGFWSNGVTDFDVLGMSYYWAWHKPTTIADAGNVIAQMKQLYPGKEVMIFETGYPWTLAANDNANNIINELHPNYSPATPENQKKWMVDLTQEVVNKGGKGVIYWEPAWVSSTCWTPWGQGSHQEHATFFDFQTNLLPNGGLFWAEQSYQGLSAANESAPAKRLEIIQDTSQNFLTLKMNRLPVGKPLKITLFTMDGKVAAVQKMEASEAGAQVRFLLPDLASGHYYVAIHQDNNLWATQSVMLK